MEHEIKTLTAQNHLIDMLDFGLTYPIRNLPVRPKNNKVAFGETTFILIACSEPGVTYALHDEEDQPFPGQVFEEKGNGGTIEIETPPINDVTIFKVFATKKSGTKTLSTYLITRRPLTVQVGLDAGIEIKLADGTDTYDYNSRIRVEIPLSQEGVLYRLTDDKKNLLSDPVLGNRSAITLNSIPLEEDTQIIVIAVKPNNPGNPPPLNKWEDLETILPKILIRPNKAVSVQLDKALPLDYNSASNIRITDSQKSTTYQVFIYELLDNDYVHNRITPVDGPDVITEIPQGFSRVKVKLPTFPFNWNAPGSFVKTGQPKSGRTGGRILPLPKLKEDALVVILAEKMDTGLREVLNAKPLALVKPNTSQAIQPQNLPVPKGEKASILVIDSQPGVKYQLRNNQNNSNVGTPGYHHKNKGIGTGIMELDFVVGTFDTTFTQLQTSKLNQTTEFKVRAIKASTSIHAMMDQTVNVEVSQ